MVAGGTAGASQVVSIKKKKTARAKKWHVTPMKVTRF